MSLVAHCNYHSSLARALVTGDMFSVENNAIIDKVALFREPPTKFVFDDIEHCWIDAKGMWLVLTEQFINNRWWTLVLTSDASVGWVDLSQLAQCIVSIINECCIDE